MKNAYDRVAKRIIRKAIEPGGGFTCEMEIAPDAQRFDGYFVPDPARIPARPRDLLDRMSARPSAFEAFHATPGKAEVVACVRKLLNIRHVLGLQDPVPPLPFLWILSAGRPRAGLAAVRAIRMRGFPRGVYEAAPGLSTGIVALSELPRTRATLLLRLTGAGRTRWGAITEALRDEDTRERWITTSTLVECADEIADDPLHTREDEEFLMETRDVVGELMNKGRTEGRIESFQKSLIRIYRARFYRIPRELRAAIEQTRDEAALTAWIDLFATRPAPEIAAALRAH